MRYKILFAFCFVHIYSISNCQYSYWEKYCDLPIFGKHKNQVLFNGEIETKNLNISLKNIIINKSGVIFGIKEKNLNHNDFLYRSIDNGKTWINISKNVPDAVDPEFEGLKHLAQYQQLIKNLKTYDAGLELWQDWLILRNGDNNMLGSFTWLSKDNGNTWLLIINEKVYEINYIFSKTINNLIIKYGYDESKTSYAKKSIDFGKTWQDISYEEFCKLELTETLYENKVIEVYPPHRANFGKEIICLYKYEDEKKWGPKESILSSTKLNDPNLYVENACFNNSTDKAYDFVNVMVPIDFIGDDSDLNQYKSLHKKYEEHWDIVKRISNLEWRTTSRVENRYHIRAIDCNNNIYRYFNLPRLGICRSQNGGISWDTLDIKPFNDLNFASLNFDGKFYMPYNGILYRSKEKIDCGISKLVASKENKVKYGTTIITHGFQLMGNAPVYEKGDWGFDMAVEILKKANSKGCIKRYNKQSGDFDTISDICTSEGETILLFDWAEESNNNTHGYSEAAGDALFAAIMNLYDKGEISLENLHFIGHSRGTVVTSECVLRLLSVVDQVEHVTYLDPHDWGVNTGPFSIIDDFDVQPGSSHINGIDDSNQAVFGWEGIKFCDTYYQNAGCEDGNCNDCGSCLLCLEGRSVAGSQSELWNYYGECKQCHSNIHSCGYTKSIISPLEVKDKEGGYKWSRLGGKIPTDSKIKGVWRNFSFFKNLEFTDNKGKKVSRIRGVLNGSFDRHGLGIDLPGWEFHGGERLSKFEGFPDELHGMKVIPYDEFDFSNDYAKLTYYFASKHPISLTHNRFYIPKDAKALTFKLKTQNAKSSTLNVIIQTQNKKSKDKSNNENEKPFQFSLVESTDEFKEYAIDIGHYQGKVITLKFEFTSELSKTFPSHSKEKCYFYLDDVAITDKEILNPNRIELGNEAFQTTTKSDLKNEIKTITDSNKLQFQNHNFKTGKNWSYTGGKVSFKDDLAILVPQNKNLPVKLLSSACKLSNIAKFLKIKLDKAKVGLGEMNVVIKDLKNSKEEVIYFEKIDTYKINRNSKIHDDNTFNKVDTKVNNTKQNFEILKIDISQYKNRQIALEINFWQNGMKKSELSIDWIKIE